MFLRKIKLSNFKNHENGEYLFTKKITAFVGGNGVGKTNLLDLIYFLGLTKSFFNLTDQQLINKGKEYIRLEASLKNNDIDYDLLVKMPLGKRKEFFLNEVKYDKISDHIGLIPTIVISPEDVELIHGSSDTRRKLIDAVLSQIDKNYLMALIQYNKVLDQRNALLKSKAPNESIDTATLSFYDLLLTQHGTFIFTKRSMLIGHFAQFFNTYYATLSDEAESVSWQYVSQLQNTDWTTLFSQRLNKDRLLQRTTGGIHRDDFEFGIGDEKIKKFGSQGQQKSFLIAMKLSLYQFIALNNKQLPILLLDDIFDKLDKKRVKNLIEILVHDEFGQVFITDTDELRINEAFIKHIDKLQIVSI